MRSAAFDGLTAKAKKRARQLHDAGDRAQTFRQPGMGRIPLDEICDWPEIRCGLGVSSLHVHELSHHIIACGVSRDKYDHVDLVKIPTELLAEIREANRIKCTEDPLMPTFSEAIK